MGFGPFFMAQTVALYLPIGHEVDTSSLITQLHIAGKTVCLPVVKSGHKLGFSRFQPGDSLQTGGYGILEPQVKEWIDITQIELMFLPLLGFDVHGTRLGYGGGYYDRALSVFTEGKSGPVLAGLAFSFQEVALLPLAAHDVPLHYIVTENGVRGLT